MFKKRLYQLRRSHSKQIVWLLQVLFLVLALLIGLLVPFVLADNGEGGEGELPFLDDMLIGGVPIVALIIIMVQILKDWGGVPGQYLRWISLGLGFGFGVLYQWGMGWPTAAQGWVVFIVRLFYGVLSSGLVDLARDLISRVNCKPATVIMPE
jgi:hypothetical protein